MFVLLNKQVEYLCLLSAIEQPVESGNEFNTWKLRWKSSEDKESF